MRVHDDSSDLRSVRCPLSGRMLYIIVMKSVHKELVMLDNIMFAKHLFKYLRIAIIILLRIIC